LYFTQLKTAFILTKILESPANCKCSIHSQRAGHVFGRQQIGHYFSKSVAIGKKKNCLATIRFSQEIGKNERP